jgi:S1-C subfamily serine protease
LRARGETGDAGAENDLGVLYDSGNGVARDAAEAVKWFRKAAEQGHAVAQYNLGAKYATGEGVPQDAAEALKWYRAAAAQGYGRAQYNVGIAYANGQAVPRDYVMAAVYFGLAAEAMTGDAAEKAKANHDRIVTNLAADQVARVNDIARTCRDSHFKTCGASDAAKASDALKAGMPGTLSTGSAFYVNGDGYLVTNAHVVGTCKVVRSPSIGMLQRISIDNADDLALLKAPVKAQAFARMHVAKPIRPGDTVLAVGYPYSSALRTGSTVTSGIVAALSGLHDDARYLQMTAPVQHGNSGGPLLGPTGALVGVVDAALVPNDITRMTNDIPQNVNFAVSSATLRAFLESNRVAYETSNGEAARSLADIAEEAMKYTLPIECTE